MRNTCRTVQIDEVPLNTYGSLEASIRHLRDHRPLDLHLPHWQKAHPEGTYTEWQRVVRNHAISCLHYDPGPVDLQSEVISTTIRDGLVYERVAFNTAPWFRVEGYFLYPTGMAHPLPGLVVMHAWGGPMIFGAERIVNSGRDHPLLRAYRDTTYSGRYLADEYARQGYAVIVIDAFHFGSRSPRGIADIPDAYDPFDLSTSEAEAINQRCVAERYQGLKQLIWAGTTWAGVNFVDDQRCIDYLCSRPEVDPNRIGCTGLSGGGWRTNLLAAFDPRIKASVSVGWMTTGDHQQVYNMRGAIGTFCHISGLWNRLDLPDLVIAGTPCASMVVLGEQDNLVPQAGIREAARQITNGYAWAGCPERFHYHHPPTKHVYDADIQDEAFAWFERWLSRE